MYIYIYIYVYIYICNSYTMGKRDLPDIYTQSPRAAGPRAEGVYIRQIPSAHGITNIFHITLCYLIQSHK